MMSQTQKNVGIVGNRSPLCMAHGMVHVVMLADMDVVCCVVLSSTKLAANMRWSLFNINVLKPNVQLIPRRKHIACMTETNRLMLFSEITAINS
jgi:hypothetical protein